MTVGEYLQIAVFNSLFNPEISKGERLKAAEQVGLESWEEQTPDEVEIFFRIVVGGVEHITSLVFGRPRNDGSFSYIGGGEFEEV